MKKIIILIKVLSNETLNLIKIVVKSLKVTCGMIHF